MYLVFKATYHDTQQSYNRQAHIMLGNQVACGRKLGIFWDVYSKEYETLQDLFSIHDPAGICSVCRHSKRLTPHAADGLKARPSDEASRISIQARGYVVEVHRRR